MKATLNRVAAFDIKIGQVDLGRFTEVSQWEGLAKLMNSAGQTLIVVLPGEGLSATFDSIFGLPIEARILMASPDLLPAGMLPPTGAMQPAEVPAGPTGDAQ